MAEQKGFPNSISVRFNLTKNCDTDSVPYQSVYALNKTDWNSKHMSDFLNSNSSFGQNGSGMDVLPREMTFNDDSVLSVIAYCCLFVVAASGNLMVLITLFRTRRIKSRVNLFIMHLSIADLIVAFIMLPLETAWHITVSWQAGDAACRILMFFRALGFYLSSFVLVTISLDRYFSIVHPMSLHDADRRGKIMLTIAWILSIVAALPQVSWLMLYKRLAVAVLPNSEN
ncbi:hypothetical protein KUTeg_017593 [Tegillarca granosa]|uniref:G-protein coupled receptors family 1 profile domain-containing protein n=1 Tax=Tegillarca granosa TaxID=220873 RepID=A0ABQ9EFQ3_TEGGR|nr:hypothetical protein KUTeg_017593 [Tegillarca granosa]